MSTLVLIDDERIATMPVKDCGEPLVDLRPVPWLEVDGRQADAGGHYARVRTGVRERLRTATRALPAGYRLVVVEGYRSPELQRRYFDEHTALLGARRPTWSARQVHDAAVRYVSPPEVAPHTTGGAVDVTLRGPDGDLCWMGTEVYASPEESDGACYTDAGNVHDEGRAHRRVLVDALTTAGFVNYPTEWWHWSYGDRYWAVVTGAAYAVNGPLSQAT
ncbi:M15 family metallopeptidase [Streptomyces deccanensis]|uniref:M15 family metallopeptidase n=1 Tax=Streptomyces deccanensis TaxID=424188 RepID=UPI001EFB5359|nr:M15 family metallopeptidase [Streptomyces deccanensis]ULR48385.1 D-alanyl-D-alanine carboxypeptidase family protein [Streptomyces deccanensis]